MFTVRTHADISKVLVKLETLSNFSRLVPEVNRTLAQILSIMRRSTPISRGQTATKGNLREGWTTTPATLISRSRISGSVVNLDPRSPWLLKYLTKGTRRHVIRPVSRKALSFNVSGGDGVIAGKVSHPGTPPNKALSGVAEQVRQKILGLQLSAKLIVANTKQ